MRSGETSRGRGPRRQRGFARHTAQKALIEQQWLDHRTPRMEPGNESLDIERERVRPQPIHARRELIAELDSAELPDIVVYVEALQRHVAEQRLTDIRLKTPFLLRSVDPPITDLIGQPVTDVRRIS